MITATDMVILPPSRLHKCAFATVGSGAQPCFSSAGRSRLVAASFVFRGIETTLNVFSCSAKKHRFHSGKTRAEIHLAHGWLRRGSKQTQPHSFFSKRVSWASSNGIEGLSWRALCNLQCRPRVQGAGISYNRIHGCCGLGLPRQ
jgi:hypothetical protein